MTKPAALLLIATIDKSRSAQLRVSISQWRERVAVELQECVAAISGIYSPTNSKVTLDLNRLHELIDALKTAEIEARKLGLLPAGSA